MQIHWLGAAQGLGIYVALCLFSWSVGRGLLRLCRLRTDDRSEAALSPVLTFVFWTLGLGVLGGAGVPVRTVSLYLWAASLAIAVVGMRRPWPEPRAVLPPLLLCLALPIVAVPRFFADGLTRSTAGASFDGFFTMAMGEYAWERGLSDYRNRIPGEDPFADLAAWQHGPGRHDDLNLIHQFAVAYPGHRFIAAGLLGFLSPLASAGDTVVTAPLLDAWVLFCLGCAVLGYWVAQGRPLGFTLIATALAVDAGWTAVPAWANQFDNLLALVYLPALAFVMDRWETACRRKWVLLGCFLGGLWLAYPAGGPFVMGAAGLLALPRLWRERRDWRPWARGVVLALAVAAALWLPGGPGAMTYLRAHYGATFDTHGLLPGLDVAGYYPGVAWGLGGETPGKPHTALSNPAAWVLTILALIGLNCLVRRGQAGVAACVVLMTGGAAYSLLRLHYPYAMLKLLSMSWWCFAAAVVSGGAWLANRFRGARWRRAVALGLALGGWGLNVELALYDRTPYWPSRYARQSADAFRLLRFVPELTGGEPVLVSVDDWLASLLAVYYLRDMPIHLASPRSWLVDPVAVAFRQKFTPVPIAGVRYVLTDDGGATSDLVACGHVVSAGGPYRLWRLDPERLDDVTLLAADPPVLEWSGTFGRCIGLAEGPRVLYVHAKRAGVLCLKARCLPGQRLPSPADCRLSVAVDGHRRQRALPEPGQQTIAIPVAGGVTRIELSIVGQPGLPMSQATAWEMLRLEQVGLSLADDDHHDLPATGPMGRPSAGRGLQ